MDDLLDSEKPHKGRIIVHGEYSAPGYGLGYGYWCKFVDHPAFAGKTGHTSFIVYDERDRPRHKGDSYEIATRNSRYTVVSAISLVPFSLDKK